MTENVALSKRLSLVLRHSPQTVGLSLDRGGWVPVDQLLSAMAISLAELEAVVLESGKQRFIITDGRIRAQQGHSVPVDLGYGLSAPPDELWHGTPRRNLESILNDGLRKQKRHAVHLSPDRAGAVAVGSRRGEAVVLRVDAAGMSREGCHFSVSGNGVWLVEAVPPRFLSVDQAE